MDEEQQLDELLSAAALWLGDMQSGRFDNLAESLVLADSGLRGYLQDRELGSMGTGQRQKLQGLLSLQQQGIQLLRGQQQQVQEKLLELRQGRSMSLTYRGNSR